MRSFRGLALDNGGVAIVDFALVAPFLLLTLVSVTDLGRGIYAQIRVAYAAEAGAEYAARNGFDATGISNAVSGATSFAAIQANPAPTQYCGCAQNGGSSVMIAQASCGSTCPNSGLPAGIYVQVNSQAAWTRIFAYPSFPRNAVTTAQSTVRIQ